jgi:hypothetical protein
VEARRIVDGGGVAQRRDDPKPGNSMKRLHSSSLNAICTMSFSKRSCT